MNKIVSIFLCILFISCNSTKNKEISVEPVTEISKQTYLFNNLVKITKNKISDIILNDSLAFLILPVQASCPPCRKKTIDSIIKYRNNLASNHFIIISANGGRKTISSYFREENGEIPEIEGHVYLDSINQANKLELYKDKPTMYYTYKRKVYKKVAAIPSTVRQDLQEFFSGFRELKTTN